jgi:hypothetical protein
MFFNAAVIFSFILRIISDLEGVGVEVFGLLSSDTHNPKRNR